MGINKNITIVSEVLAVKASRLAAVAQQQQASRIVIAEDDVRPTTRKPKAGKQALQGRVRVERAREVEEVETPRSTREIYAEMMDIIREMQRFAAENPPAWVKWELDRYGRGLVVMASPWSNVPCPICSTYCISEEGLARLKEDSGWMA